MTPHPSLLRWGVLLCPCALLAALGGCKHYPPRIEGKVLERTDEEIRESYSLNSPASDPRFPPLQGAILSVSVRKGGGATIVEVKTKPDGSFVLELPDQLPEGAILVVSAEGYESFFQPIDENPPGYVLRTFVLKKKKRA